MRDVRPPRLADANGLSPKPMAEASQVSRVIRSRLQVLEQGKWLDAVDEALVDVEAADFRSAQRRTEAQSLDEEMPMTSTLEAAIFKILHGDTRTGHRVLRSHGLHPPCPETARLMQSKFITDPAKDSIAQEPDLRNRAWRCKAPKVQPKLVAKVIGNTHDCKASGISA